VKWFDALQEHWLRRHPAPIPRASAATALLSLPLSTRAIALLKAIQHEPPQKAGIFSIAVS